MDVLSVFLDSKPAGEVVLGPSLAIIGIQIDLFGPWYITRAIEPPDSVVVGVVWYLGILTHVVGTALHNTYAFVTFGVQAADSVPPRPTRRCGRCSTGSRSSSSPLDSSCWPGCSSRFGLLFIVAASRRTAYPRWFGLVNHLVGQAVTGAAALVAPLGIGAFLIAIAYNLSLSGIYAASTVLVRTGRTVDGESAEAEITRQATA